MGTWLRALVIAFMTTCVCGGEEQPAVPVRIQTRDGSRLTGLVLAPASLSFRTSAGATLGAAWRELQSLALGERFDPELENQARLAVNELSSDQYETRKRALERLRSLGPAAARALREAARSADAEVAARSKELLAECAALDAGEAGDQWTLSGARTGAGEWLATSLDLRTRWGTLRFPPAAVERIEALAPERAAELEKELGPPAAGAAPIPVQPPPPVPAGPRAQRFTPGSEEDPLDAAGFAAGAGLMRGGRLAGFETAADGKTKLAPGDSVEDAYASWGLLLRAGKKSQTVAANDAEQILGISRGLSASIKEQHLKGVLELHFILPSSWDAQARQGRVGGVHAAGCWIGKASEGRIGMEAFDRSGRLLARVFNRQEGLVAAGGAMAHEFLGLRSKVPITRVRIFQTNVEEEAVLRIDDVVFDRIGAVERDERFAAAELRSGERLAGQPVAADPDAPEALRLRLAFLPESAAPAVLKFSGLVRFEPPHEPVRPGNPLAVEGPPARPAPALRALHAVLLQNGEGFRAQLVRLDAERVTFALPGGAELVLPRAALRKLDLRPEPGAPGEAPAPLAVAADEKPGVEFLAKASAAVPAAPLVGPPAPPVGPDPKPDPAQNPAQGLPRMDNAEILTANFETNELVVDPKDGGGAWPIDLATARTLVFPPLAAQAAGAAGPAPEWILTLRQGHQFEARWKSADAGGLRAEIAGGAVALPYALIESLARKEKKE